MFDSVSSFFIYREDMKLERVLKACIEWYKNNDEAVFFSDFFTAIGWSDARLQKEINNATVQELDLFNLIRSYELTRLKRMALNKEVSTPFVMNYIKLFHNIKQVEEDRKEDEFSKLVQDHFGMKKSGYIEVDDEAN